MPLLKKFFPQAKQDKDSDNTFVGEGFIRHAENLRTYINGTRSGSEANIKGNTQVGTDHTSGMTGSSKVCGRHYSKNLRTVFYFIGNEDGSSSKIIKHNKEDNTSSVLVSATGTPSVLNFQKDTFISGIHEEDGYLYWCNPLTAPMRCRVDGEFLSVSPTIEELSLKVKPPVFPPKILLKDSGTALTDKENNIEEKPICFATRYRYYDGQYSDLSPFSEYAFYPEDFSYNFAEQSNPSMVNRHNQAEITFETGSYLVEEVQLVFKVAGSTVEYIVDDYKKDDPNLSWQDNTEETVVFDNNKTYRLLSDLVSKNYFSNVPRLCSRMSGMGSRLIMGDYTENFNLVDSDGDPIFMDYSLELVSEENTTTIDGEIVPTLIPKKTVKTNRDVQVGIVYLGDFGRASTVLVSSTNSIHIPVSKAGNRNRIKVLLNNPAPYWATHYRFFVSTDKGGYDNLLPTLFYEDNSFRWVKLEGADKGKIEEGDFVTIKSTPQGVSESLIKTKILEIKSQEQNFLQSEDSVSTIEQLPGLYYKIRPSGFPFDAGDLESYKLETFDSSRNEYNDPVRGLTSYVSPAHFYGDGLNDVTSGGSYTGGTNERHRYVIQIEVGGATFKWSDDGGATFPNTGVAVGTGISLSNGVTVTFGSVGGYTAGDEWTINARAVFSVYADPPLAFCYGFFRISKLHGELSDPANFDDDIIYAGARIEMTFNQYGKDDDFFKITNTSSQQYDDIEEWFHKEGIEDEILSQSTIEADNIHFVRGALYNYGNATQITQNLTEGIMTMVVRSTLSAGSLNRNKARATSELIQNTSPYPYCFETEGDPQVDGLYYEVPATYAIQNGLHLGNGFKDANQTNNSPAAIILPFWNAFSYGNGVECAKVKDEFKMIGINNGVRSMAVFDGVFKETRRKSSVQWSDVYAPDGVFNGFGGFYLSETNFIDLKQEDGAVTGLVESQGNLQVIQESNALMLPFNKSVIEDAQGGQAIGLVKNVLDPRSAREYQGGKYGCQDPASISTDGFRTYFVDRERNSLIRLSIDGVTIVTKPHMHRWFIESMKSSAGVAFHSVFDRVTDEYLVLMQPAKTGEIIDDFSSLDNKMVLSFHEDSKGIPLFYTFEPDMMVSAEDELYSWKDGVMYRHNVNAIRNNYYGAQYDSRIVFVANQAAGVEKTLNAIRLQGNSTWDVDIQSETGTATIPKEWFERKETHWFSKVGGDETTGNGNTSKHGIGVYSINSGVITLGVKTLRSLPLLSVGDEIATASNPNGFTTPIYIDDIDYELGKLYLSNSNFNETPEFIMYMKSAQVDGNSLKGDYFIIQMTNSDTSEVYLKSVSLEVSRSMLTE